MADIGESLAQEQMAEYRSASETRRDGALSRRLDWGGTAGVWMIGVGSAVWIVWTIVTR
ncbi:MULTISPECIES: hypothetical protein [unclassified Streptomyces]|uniref:hypothetical protein n=1 Tax=unclassified Streptomyces TaxID=2593676 RepID=UPI003830504A